jgi:hypothetical protein
MMKSTKTARPSLTLCGLTMSMADDEIERCKRQKLSPAEFGRLMTQRAGIVDAMFYSGASYHQHVRRDALKELKRIDARLGFPFEHERELARLDWRIAHPEAARLQDIVDEYKATLTFLDNFRSGGQSAARTSWYTPRRAELLAKVGVLVKQGRQWVIDHASADQGVSRLQAHLQELERRVQTLCGSADIMAARPGDFGRGDGVRAKRKNPCAEFCDMAQGLKAMLTSGENVVGISHVASPFKT